MQYKQGLGLPYMGSKRKLAKPIFAKIMKDNPGIRFVYDLFGGGGAMSFEAVQHPLIKKVFYNELSTSVVKLLKKIMTDGVTSEMYKWVSREEFFRHKDDKTWYGGLLSVVWSFGNNGSSYLFGKEIEEDKRLLHEIVVNECEKSLIVFNKKFELNIKLEKENSFFSESINDRRLRLTKYIGIYLKEKYHNNGVINMINSYSNLLQPLERLEHLERLQHQQLQLSNLSYKDVKITTPINETIIYLDPPYANTAKYNEKLNHNELINYIKNSKYKIYLSSYDFPSMTEVERYEHRSTLSATANNLVTEKLYRNKK